MQTIAHNPISVSGTQSFGMLEHSAGWFFAAGVLQILLGAFGVVFGFVATFSTAFALGVLLLWAGVAQFIAAIRVDTRCRLKMRHSVLAPLYTATGIATLAHPVINAQTLTLILASTLMVLACFRIFGAIADLPPKWGWMLVHGITTLLLGTMIWCQWPWSGLWVIGVLIGIDLIYSGMWCIATGSIVGSAAKSQGTSSRPAIA